LAALALTWLGGCAEEPELEEVLRPVRTQKVFVSGASRARSFSGIAKADREIDLSFRVSGSIELLPVRIGNRVGAGDVIAQLDRTDYEIAVRQAQANLANAQATLRNAEADLERVRALWENDNVSQNELDQARAQSESAAASVAAAAEALQGAERQRVYTRLTAPLAGAIASVDVEVNENVSQGQPIVRITSGAEQEVEVAIPEVLISQIREGAAVTVAFDAIPGRSFAAVVTEVGVAATGTATTFPVTVRLAQASDDVRSGMAAEVTFDFRPRDGGERIVLPTYAVGGDRGGRFVYVLVPSDEPGVGRVRRKDVEVGDLTREGLEIISGLTEGEEVVTAGVRRLTDGQRVRLLAPEPAS
jgi:RND family efflux transporter MFP subunit